MFALIAAALIASPVVKVECHDPNDDRTIVEVGSGFISNGKLITADHVLSSGRCFANNRTVRNVTEDSNTDYAVAIPGKITGDVATACETVHPGETYTAVGYPVGDDSDPVSLTIIATGYVAGQDKYNDTIKNALGTTEFKATSGSFIEGMSGGPIYNSNHVVVGFIVGRSADGTLSYGRMLVETKMCQVAAK